MNNSDTALIVISFNEGHQSLRGQWGIFKRRNLLWDIKITRGGSPEPIETLFTFWRVVSSVAMKKNVKATERKGSAVCCILLWLNPQPVFMDSCLTISHMCLPCLPSRWVSPYVLCPLFIELVVVLLTFFWVWFQFYGNMLLCSGMGMEFKDKVMLHCFREMGCQQGFTAGIWY